jgi:hypothetical protein
MLGTRLQEEVLLIDFDLHYGSLMLALDLEAIDALREALDQPDRIDALFIQQVAQKKSDFLYAIGAEEPPGGGFQARPHAATDFLRSVHRRFRWIVADVPRGDPVIQRQLIEASTDIVLVTDLSLPGVRDAMRLHQLAHDVAPQARLHLVTSGIVDPRRSAVKVADLERTLKRKVDCQFRPIGRRRCRPSISASRWPRRRPTARSSRPCARWSPPRPAGRRPTKAARRRAPSCAFPRPAAEEEVARDVRLCSTRVSDASRRAPAAARPAGPPRRRRAGRAPPSRPIASRLQRRRRALPPRWRRGCASWCRNGVPPAR